MGWPISWFEPCDHIKAEGLVLHDGELSLPGRGDFMEAFRMKDKYRKKAGW
jgi:hypothetical protein